MEIMDIKTLLFIVLLVVTNAEKKSAGKLHPGVKAQSSTTKSHSSVSTTKANIAEETDSNASNQQTPITSNALQPVTENSKTNASENSSNAASESEQSVADPDLGSVVAQALTSKDSASSQPASAVDTTTASASETVGTLENETPDGKDNAISKAAILKPEPITIVQSDSKQNKTVSQSQSTSTGKKSKPEKHHSSSKKKSKASKKGKRPRPFTEVVPDTTIKTGPHFNWEEVKNRTKLVAKIPGGGSTLPPIDIVGLLKMIPLHTVGSQRTTIDVPIEKVLNDTVLNQADIASLDERSEQPEATNITSETATDPNTNMASNSTTAQPDDHSTSTLNETVGNSADNATVLSDTDGKRNISKSSGIKVPTNIPDKCSGLIKTYTNGELTLKDYLKEMRKCKSATSKKSKVGKAGLHFNSTTNRTSGPNSAIERKAYYYALQRMRNYAPSRQEAAQANAIIDSWRSHSFGERHDKVPAKLEVPNAIKSFMMVQGDLKLNKTVTDTSKSQAIATSPINADDQNSPVKDIGVLTKTNIGTSPIDNLPVPNAAIGMEAPSSPSASIPSTTFAAVSDTMPSFHPEIETSALPVKETTKSLYVDPSIEAISNVQPALTEAEFRDALPNDMSSIPAPNPVPFSPKLAVPGMNKVSDDLIAALQSMEGVGPEPNAAPVAMVTSAQKRSIPIETLAKLSSMVQHIRSKRELNEKEIHAKKNEDSRTDIPANIQPGPKLMDKIRDMSRVIATP